MIVWMGELQFNFDIKQYCAVKKSFKNIFLEFWDLVDSGVCIRTLVEASPDGIWGQSPQ
jgi:hypothetical protein